jgi:hypothetical protein
MTSTEKFEGGAAAAALLAASELGPWVTKETGTWSSTMVVTLNGRAKVRTGTGAFINPDEALFRKSVALACNVLDRAVYGKRVQRFGRRIPRIPFLEYGHDRGWHCHVLIEPPYFMPREAFIEKVRQSWERSPCGSTCHVRDGDQGSAGYLTKARSKDALEVWTDTLIVEAVVLRTK